MVGCFTSEMSSVVDCRQPFGLLAMSMMLLLVLLLLVVVLLLLHLCLWLAKRDIFHVATKNCNAKCNSSGSGSNNNNLG